MKRNACLLVLAILSSLSVYSQEETLFTIDNQPVTKSEFERIYHKNNNATATDKSVKEYLDLYINFKLKVLEAEHLGYDTMQSFIKELAGYRDQLAKPYLQDRELIDRMVKDAYYRSVNEINASHIMVAVPNNATPEDTLAAYNKIMAIRNRILAGEPFEKVAAEVSDDQHSKINGGNLGWFSAFRMVFPFEDAAYKTPVGQISMPVRSRFGYHIIKVNAMRPAMGEIKLGHIMTRAGKNEGADAIEKAKQKIYTYYGLLQKGMNFGDVARAYSEDPSSARNNGQMRWLRSGELPPDIEEKVFALKDSGSYTEPIQSEFGWHIFQLQGRRPLPTFDEMKSQLEDHIMSDERGTISQESFLNKIKKESNFKEYPENIRALADVLDSSVYKGLWTANSAGELIEPVFVIGDKEYTQKDLADFIVQTKRYMNSESLENIANLKCDELINNQLMQYQKDGLEAKYPDFKNLMQEYHDGILLFNITDDKVWTKAIKDTIGLENYFNNHKKEYTWNTRVSVSTYTVNDTAYRSVVMQLIAKGIPKNLSNADFVKQVCGNDSTQCISVSENKYEKSDNPVVDGMTWKKGTLKEVKDDSGVKIYVINSVLKPSKKSFEEAKGPVTADYQNFLDKQWIAELRAKHNIVVNQDVLNEIH